jgi:O-antigen ligase
MYTVTQRIRVVHIPNLLEYSYYTSVFYQIFGSTWGLSVGMLGVGMLMVLAAFCLTRLGSQAMTVYTPIAYPLGCAFSLIWLQVFLHGESLMGEYVRPFIPWVLTLIIVQSLSLRQGFLRRFALVAFLIGLAALPHLQVSGSNLEYERLGLEQTGGLSNPNDLAAWYGFCATYFIIVGIDTKRGAVRMASWLIAIGCMYIVSLAVTRAVIFAVAAATIVALHRLLKRGFFPVLVLMILVWATYESGLFDQASAFYAARATEETGRFLVWPLALERFLGSPLTGVGISRIATDVPFGNHPITPHNSFLFIALASGLIPLAFFLASWIQAVKRAFRSSAQHLLDAPFLIPLLIYALLISLELNQPYLTPWMTVTLVTAMSAGMSCQGRRVAVSRTGNGEAAQHARHWGEAIYFIPRSQLWLNHDDREGPYPLSIVTHRMHRLPPGHIV